MDCDCIIEIYRCGFSGLIRRSNWQNPKWFVACPIPGGIPHETIAIWKVKLKK